MLDFLENFCGKNLFLDQFYTYYTNGIDLYISIFNGFYCSCTEKVVWQIWDISWLICLVKIGPVALVEEVFTSSVCLFLVIMCSIALDTSMEALKKNQILKWFLLMVCSAMLRVASFLSQSDAFSSQHNFKNLQGKIPN